MYGKNEDQTLRQRGFVAHDRPSGAIVRASHELYGAVLPQYIFRYTDFRHNDPKTSIDIKGVQTWL